MGNRRYTLRRQARRRVIAGFSPPCPCLFTPLSLPKWPHLHHAVHSKKAGTQKGNCWIPRVVARSEARRRVIRSATHLHHSVSAAHPHTSNTYNSLHAYPMSPVFTSQTITSQTIRSQTTCQLKRRQGHQNDWNTGPSSATALALYIMWSVVTHCPKPGENRLDAPRPIKRV